MSSTSLIIRNCCMGYWKFAMVVDCRDAPRASSRRRRRLSYSERHRLWRSNRGSLALLSTASVHLGRSSARSRGGRLRSLLLNGSSA